MSFEEEIQDWVTIDNRLKLLNEEVKQLRTRRSELSDTILNYVETHALARVTVKISDGKIKFINTKVTSPLTYKIKKPLPRLVRAIPLSLLVKIKLNFCDNFLLEIRKNVLYLQKHDYY